MCAADHFLRKDEKARLGWFAVLNNLIERLEDSGKTKANRDRVWRIFSDHRKWHSFSDIYGNMLWVQGQPWHPGSRLRIEILEPVPTVIDHVIISCTPREQVAWIDHGLGISMEQWVNFDPLPEGGTRIRTWAEFTGQTAEIAGRSVREILWDFISQWYEKFGVYCDQWEFVPDFTHAAQPRM